MTFEESFKKLEEYIISENYRGYDPYDTLNSWIPFKYCGKWPAAVAIQIQKRNPINIRPLLGVKKGINPKAYGLFLQAYSRLFQKTNEPKYLEQANYFFNWLKENYSKGYSGYAWGYNFPWANPDKYMDSYIPSAVVSGFVAKGIFEYYKITNNKKAKEILISASDFTLNDIPITEADNGICFSYTPLQRDLCFNSSLLAAEILAMAYDIAPKEELKEKAILAVDWVVSHQKDNGKWNYSIDTDTKRERIQIDFHQGFVLESIFNIKNILSIKNTKWEVSLKRGIKFYREQQFLSNGVSYWRLPKKYPIEIHNQAQGIITFIKLKEYYPSVEEFANTIANWSIENMQAKNGHFYYQKFKTHTHKISYMRWSQAWMFLALSYLLVFNKM